jgi:ribosomal protein L6P/L9E
MSIGREVVVLQYPKVVQAWDIPCRFPRILSVTDETGHKGQPQFSQYITIHQKRSDHEHHHRMNQEWSGSNSCFHFTLRSQDDIDAMVRDKTTTFASRLEYIYMHYSYMPKCRVLETKPPAEKSRYRNYILCV